LWADVDDILWDDNSWNQEESELFYGAMQVRTIQISDVDLFGLIRITADYDGKMMMMR